MNNRFRIVVASDPDYENLVAEVYFADEIVCMFTQEGGSETMTTHLFPRKDGRPWVLNTADLEEATGTARRRLTGLQREGDGNLNTDG